MCGHMSVGKVDTPVGHHSEDSRFSGANGDVFSRIFNGLWGRSEMRIVCKRGYFRSLSNLQSQPSSAHCKKSKTHHAYREISLPPRPGRRRLASVGTPLIRQRLFCILNVNLARVLVVYSRRQTGPTCRSHFRFCPFMPVGHPPSC
jgi:hypothetical protein